MTKHELYRQWLLAIVENIATPLKGPRPFFYLSHLTANEYVRVCYAAERNMSLFAVEQDDDGKASSVTPILDSTPWDSLPDAFVVYAVDFRERDPLEAINTNGSHNKKHERPLLLGGPVTHHCATGPIMNALRSALLEMQTPKEDAIAQ